MQIDPQVVLAVVGGVLLVLALRDVIRHRRITPAAKGRLLTAGVFLLVLIWHKWFA